MGQTSPGKITRNGACVVSKASTGFPGRLASPSAVPLEGFRNGNPVDLKLSKSGKPQTVDVGKLLLLGGTKLLHR